MKPEQTAVEWLMDNLPSLFVDDSGHYKQLFEQAKAMEREQIETAYERGLNFPWALGCEIDNYQEEAKQYYKDNYGKPETEHDPG